jgi:MFS family permease
MRAVILGAAVQRFGEVRVLRLGAFLLAVGIGSAPFAQSPWQFLVAILLLPAGTALLFPSTTSLISRYATPEEVGQTMGVQQSFGGMSRLVGPVWAGAAFQHLGPAEPFWLAAALVFLTGLFALRLSPGEARKPRRAPEASRASPPEPACDLATPAPALGRKKDEGG